MPLFEFTCDHCATTFEELVALTQSTPALSCPACGSSTIRKRVSTFASRVGQASRTAEPVLSCASGSCCLNGNCAL